MWKLWFQATLFLVAVFGWFLLGGSASYHVYMTHGDPWGFVTGLGFSLPLLAGWWVLYMES